MHVHHRNMSIIFLVTDSLSRRIHLVTPAAASHVQACKCTEHRLSAGNTSYWLVP